MSPQDEQKVPHNTHNVTAKKGDSDDKMTKCVIHTEMRVVSSAKMHPVRVDVNDHVAKQTLSKYARAVGKC